MSVYPTALRPIQTSSNGASRPDAAVAEPFRSLASRLTKYWWVELAAGVAWLAISVVVLKFNDASVTTVGVLTGVMFLLLAAQDFAAATVDPARRWLWLIFGAMLTGAGVVALIEPVATFADFADILGFVFLLIGVRWITQAFLERAFNDLWWLTLISGILMTVMAFWVSGLFFVERAYTLLIFAGVWALVTGVTSVVRAFQIRSLAAPD
jgi:uncharacterized membrane protein HdeD (DUF308 family)